LFIDRARIMVKGGDGGDGAVSFRREKHIPKGGPDGGDGGAGGDVVLLVRDGMTTLSAFRRRSHFSAGDGARGGGKKRHGKSGSDCEIHVPPGTVVLTDEGELVADLVASDQKLVVARGGRGGRGSAQFATAQKRSPRFAEKGEPGEERWILLELKLLADVGLVGLPNAGKSTLLSVISAAKPDVANYPFTTLEPNLGVVNLDYDQSFVAADLPGLIKGAHEGVGLGDEFLRHAERTALLLHLVDLADPARKSPEEAFVEIEDELSAYEVDLTDKPRIVVGTKMDLEESRRAWPDFCSWIESRGHQTVAVSAATHKGVDQLLRLTWNELLDTRSEEDETGISHDRRPKGFRVYGPPDAGPRVLKEDGEWVVRDERFERWVVMSDLDNDEAVDHLNRRLKRAGLYEILEEAGVKEGDVVRIGEVAFEYEP